MLKRMIAWIGNAFMSGSGYEKRLHAELVKIREEAVYHSELLRSIKAWLS